MRRAGWTAEDYEYDRENKAMRPYYTDDGCIALIAAVCASIVKDYKNAPTKQIKAARKHLFDNWMFGYITDGLDADEIASIVDRMPNNVSYFSPLPAGAKQYITDEAKRNKKAQYQVFKDDKFVAGYQTMKSAKRIADMCDGCIREYGKKEIYSKSLHLKG